MTTVHKKVCDRCGKCSEESNSQYSIKGYTEIEIKLPNFNNKKLLLCDECMEKLGLKEKEEAKPIYEENRFETILNLLAELVEERMGN